MRRLLVPFMILLLAPGCSSSSSSASTADGALHDTVRTDLTVTDSPVAPSDHAVPADAAVDGPAPQGSFAFISTFASGMAPRGGGRHPLVALPGGGYLLAFAFNRELTVAGETLIPKGRWDMALVKTDDQGNPLWARPMTGNDEDDIEGLAVDGQGNIYVAGASFSTSIDFGNGVTVAGDAENKAKFGFVAQLDSSGLAQWARSFKTQMGVGSARVAARGDTVAVVGHYSGNYPFFYATDEGTVSGPSFMGHALKVFVVSLSPADGAAKWLGLYGTNAEARAAAVAVAEDGSVVIAGRFQHSPLKFTDLTDVATSTTSGEDCFVSKLTASGDHVWTRAFGDPEGSALPQDLLYDASGGQVLATGSFGGKVDFGKGVRSAQSTDAWVVALDPASGNTLWDKTLGTDGDEVATGIAIDASGQMMLNLQVGGEQITPGTVDNLALAESPGTSLLWLDANHVATWLMHLPAGDSRISGGRVVMGASGTVALLGTFKGTIDFGGGDVTSASSNYDAFLLGIDP